MTSGENIKYMISTQEEQLNQPLYDATRAEIQAYAAKRELMIAETPASSDFGSASSRRARNRSRISPPCP